MSRPPNVHDNRKVRSFLEGYVSARELCEDYPAIDDILSGALELKTEGDTSTRSLSRQVLFHILQQCPTIDVSSIKAATRVPYAYNTLAAYAAVARVVSKAIERFIDNLADRKAVQSLGRARTAIDRPYADDLALAVSASRPWRPPGVRQADPILLTYIQAPEDGDSLTGLALLKRFAQAQLLEQ